MRIDIAPIAAIGALALSACGGGGGSGIASLPPGPAQTPSASEPLKSPVAIFDRPTAGEFASFSLGDPLRIRYSEAAKRYEVTFAGHDWDGLVDDPDQVPGQLLFASSPSEATGYFSHQVYTNAPVEYRYHYTGSAGWSFFGATDEEKKSGSLVFAQATPAGGVPTTGTGKFAGEIMGSADVPADAGGWGVFETMPVSGSIDLTFDFAQGSLTGRITPVTGCDCTRVPMPVLEFTDTQFAVGSRTFSGRFATGVAGPNAFHGLFAGPNAEEAIGEWAFPFLFDGAAHSASGIWQAKQ